MASGDGRNLKGKRGLAIPSLSPSPSPSTPQGNLLSGLQLSANYQKKRILGLDPGLATLGFGIIDCYIDSSKHKNHHISLIDFGVIKTPATQEMGQRLCTIHEDIRALVSQFQPDLAVAEKLFFYRMGNTIAIAQARGVLMLALAQENLPLFEFTPAQVKQALTGYGSADKSQVQEAVARELNLDYMPKPDDAADALATALTAWFDDDIVCKD